MMGGSLAGGTAATLEVAGGPRTENPRRPDPSLRRFTIASVVGIAVASVPFLWVLWDLWTGKANLLRKEAYQSNFYDLQARAILHGHLYLPAGSLGIEGYVHDHRTYTYFGLFPSLLRMPILAFTSSLDARLSAPSMVLAWIVATVFSALLIWRVRVLVRGPVLLGRAEAASYGVLVATIGGGSVLVYLAATPFVFNEDLIWSAALTIASLFALLGVLERPGRARIIATGILILCANLDRPNTGLACVIAALLVAAWFRFNRRDQTHRRWFVPMLGAALVPLAVGCAVTWARFGIPFGVPVSEQVFTHVNAYRRRFLAANGNSEVGLQFAPSAALAYLDPAGIRWMSVFPFVTLPAAPARAVGVLLDRQYPTASVPASMPLLLLLSLWGVVTGFRRRSPGRAGLLRIPLLAGALGAGALLAWGYIAPRYLADFVPFLVVGGALGLVDLWRRVEGRPRRTRLVTLAALAVLGVYCFVANVGIAISPNGEWTSVQALQYVHAQKSVSDVTGGQLTGNVVRGSVLPYWAPAQELFVANQCAGFYISTGETDKTVPLQQREHQTWVPVEQSAYRNALRVTFRHPMVSPGTSFGIVTVGPDTVVVRSLEDAGPGRIRVGFDLESPAAPSAGASIVVTVGQSYRAVVVTDPELRRVTMSFGSDPVPVLDTYLPDDGPIAVFSAAGVARPPASVARIAQSNPPGLSLCRSLDRAPR
jgi:hypothetical protein